MSIFIPQVGDVMYDRNDFMSARPHRDWFYVTKVNSNGKKVKGKLIQDIPFVGEPPHWKDAVKRSDAKDIDFWLNVSYFSRSGYGVHIDNDFVFSRRDLENEIPVIHFDFHQMPDFSLTSKSHSRGTLDKDRYWIMGSIQDSRSELATFFRKLKTKYNLRKRKTKDAVLDYVRDPNNRHGYGRDEFRIARWEGVILPSSLPEASRILTKLSSMIESDKMTKGDYISGEYFFLRSIQIEEGGRKFPL